MRTVLFLILLTCLTASAQDYTSYFTGNATDVVTQPSGGVCLMGGAIENDEAMKWFLTRAQGGDVLVLRASGSDGYNNYLYSELGVTVNSVETIVFNNASASTDSYIIDKINKAEAIWLAGGDQWKYVSYWRNTPVDAAINEAVLVRKAVIGGTSAGMAVLGSHYFTAQNGTVTSATALSNPYAPNVTVSHEPFLKVPFLDSLITDTHFDNPNRKGRLMVFMARTLKDTQVPLRAIACDEYTAVCIDHEGMARVYGDYPQYDDNAYFLQVSCEISNPQAEVCQPNSALTWHHNGQAVRAYVVKGTPAGTNTFNLSDWKTGIGGTWQFWSVNAGTLNEASGSAPVCTNSVQDAAASRLTVSPHPVSDVLHLSADVPMRRVAIRDMQGRQVALRHFDTPILSYPLPVHTLQAGVYLLHVHTTDGLVSLLIVKQ